MLRSSAPFLAGLSIILCLSCSGKTSSLPPLEAARDAPATPTGYGEDLRVDFPVAHWSFDAAAGPEFVDADWTEQAARGRALKLGEGAFGASLERSRPELSSATLTFLIRDARGPLVGGRTGADEPFSVAARDAGLRIRIGEEAWTVDLGQTPRDDWTHIAIVHDAAAEQLSVFVAGRRVWREAAPAGLALDGKNWWLGNAAGTGLLDEVALFDRAVHPSDLLGHALVRLGLRPARALDPPLQMVGIDRPGELERWAVSPDEALLAEYRSTERRFDFPRITLRSLENGAVIKQLSPTFADSKLDDFGCSELAFDPTGRLVSCAYLDRIYIWDVHSGRPWRMLSASDAIVQWMWRPDGREIVLATNDSSGEPQKLELRQPHDGEKLGSWTYSLYLDMTHNIEMSEDGRWLVSCGKSAELEIWDLERRKKLEAQKTPTGVCHLKGMRGSDNLVVVGEQPSTTFTESFGVAPPENPGELGLYLYAIPSGELVGELRGQNNAPMYGIFSDNGRWLATYSDSLHPDDGSESTPAHTVVWDLESRKMHRDLQDPKRPIRISDDGDRLLLRDFYDDAYLIFDLVELSVLERRRIEEELIRLPGGRAMTVGTDTLRHLSLDTLGDTRRVDLPSSPRRSPVSVESAGERLLLTTAKGAALFDWKRGRVTRRFDPPHRQRRPIHLSSSRRARPTSLAHADDLLAQGFCSSRDTHRTSIWSVPHRELLMELALDKERDGRCAFDLQLVAEERVALFRGNDRLVAWNLRTNRRKWAIELQSVVSMFSVFEVSPDRRFVYLLHDNEPGLIQKVRLDDGKIAGELELRSAYEQIGGSWEGTTGLEDIACLPEASECLVVTLEGLFRVDVANMKLVEATPVENETFHVSGRLSVAPQGDRVLLWSDDILEVQVRNAQNAEIVHTYRLERPPTEQVEFFGKDHQGLVVPVENGVDIWMTPKQQEPISFRFVYLADQEEFAWLAMDAGGYFAGSSNLPEAGLSAARGLQSVGLEQVALRYNRPARVLRRLGFEGREHLDYLDQLWRRRARSAGIDPDGPPSGEPLAAPEAVIAGTGPVSSDGKASLTIDFASPAAELRSMQIWVNGTLQGGGDEAMALSGYKASRSVTVRLSGGTNAVQVAATAANGLRSETDSATFVYESAAKPTLYVAALGVSEYESKTIVDLEFADDDARDLSHAFEEAAGDDFRAVETLTLVEDEVEPAALGQVAEFLGQASEDDVAVLFAAGHGMYDDGKPPTYYFLTHGADLDSLASTALPYEAFSDLLQSVRAHRKLLLLDTCASGEFPADALQAQVEAARGRGLRARSIQSRPAEPADTESRGGGDRQHRPWLLERHRLVHRPLRTDSGAVVMSSSLGAELSLEAARWRNGAFTESLLEVLGRSRIGRDPLTIRRLQQQVRAGVVRLTQNAQHPTVDRDNLLVDFALPYTLASQPSALVDVGGAALGPDGRSLLVHSADGDEYEDHRVRVYSLPDASNPTLLPERVPRADALVYSPDGRRFLSRNAAIYDTATGESVATLPPMAIDGSIDWSTRGPIAVGQPRRVRVYDGESLEELHQWRVSEDADAYRNAAVKFSGDGSTLFAVNAQGRLHAWDTANGTKKAAVDIGAPGLDDFSVSADGSRFAFAHENGVEVWSLQESAPLLSMASRFGKDARVELSADGQRIYAAMRGKLIGIDVESASIVASGSGPTSRVRDLMLDAAATHLVGVEDDGLIRIWDPDTLEQKSTIWRTTRSRRR